MSLTPAAHANEPPEATRTLTLYFPNPDNPLGPPCTTVFSFHSNPLPNAPYFDEFIEIAVRSDDEACVGVLWNTRVTISDDSPSHGTRAVSDTGEPGNPSSATAKQRVEYGVGVREAGVARFQFEAWSSIGRLCFQEPWALEGATFTKTWVPLQVPC